MRGERAQLSGAPIVMRKRGGVTDSMVLQEVMRRPGITVSEIAEALGWSNGKVDGSVNRLLLKGKVFVKHFLRRGMLVKSVYPADYHVKPLDTIEIPEEMIDHGFWRDKAVIYALSRSTIGIAPVEVEEWEKKALFKENAEIKKDEERILITLSRRLYDFYQLENSETSLSTTGKFALVTVESTLPVTLPPTHPEESRHPHISRKRSDQP